MTNSNLNNTKELPMLSISQLIYMSMGFMGIQCGFGLQNANASRILDSFGASVENPSWFWIVAPLTGMIVQPIIGHFSDSTWNKIGRRKPYFLAGTLLCCIAIVLLPNSGFFVAGKAALAIGAIFLALMDASINVAMEPFRALVADNLNEKQHTQGFAYQTCLIGLGAVIGSWLPWLLTNLFGIKGEAPAGEVAQNVIYSFYIGAAFFLFCILITVFKAKEYNPSEYELYHGKKQTNNKSGFSQIFNDFLKMPKMMVKLGVVQFFSWFALFCMWVYTTRAVAVNLYDLPILDRYEGNEKLLMDKAGNWVGILFGIYNAASAIYALLIPRIAKKLGNAKTHALNLIAGALGLFGIFVITNQYVLIISMIGIGMAWASILSMPYAILANHIPAGKMGVYMGIFNIFITIPQITSSLLSGPIIKYLLKGNPTFAMLMGALMFVIAALFSIKLQKHKPG